VGTEGEAQQIWIDPSNTKQLEAWDGDSGAFWVERAQRFDDGVAAYHARFLEAAAIEADDIVLDIGCGNGQTSRDAARLASAGSVLGVDLSSEMLALARKLAEAEQLTNVRFLQADAQCYAFDAERYDLAISRNGAMFFGDPEAAFANIGRALRPEGRLLLLAWQPLELNEWLHTFLSILGVSENFTPPPPDGPGPFGLSSEERVRDILTSAGFVDVTLHAVTEQMYFGEDTDDAYWYVAAQFDWVMRDLDDLVKARALDALRVSLEEHQGEQGVRYDSAAWLIEARRP
jgi:SAM-dependent methyltransferase